MANNRGESSKFTLYYYLERGLPTYLMFLSFFFLLLSFL